MAEATDKRTQSQKEKALEARVKQLEARLQKIVSGKVRLKAKDVRIAPGSTWVMDCE
jgi:BMFP domain-containing protein YqiC